LAKSSVNQSQSTQSKSKSKTINKQAVKKGKPKQANAKPTTKKLDYDQVISEYAKVVSPDILRDPYHSILIYCKS